MTMFREIAMDAGDTTLDLPPDWLANRYPDKITVAGMTCVVHRRNKILKQALSEGAQFVYGLVILAVSLGIIALALTIRSPFFILASLMIAPVGFWLFFSRWRRWIGSAPYCYRLLTSLGEDAENILIAHEDRKRKKFAHEFGDLYEHSRPTKE